MRRINGDRIAIVTGSLRGGGAERVVQTMAAWWVQAGYEVHVVTLRSDQAGDAWGLPDQVVVHELRLIAEHNLFFDPRHGWRLWRLRRILIDLQPAAVLSFIDKLNVAVLVALAGSGIPVIATEHVVPWLNSPGLLWRMLRALTYRHAYAVVSPTSAISEWLQSRVAGRFLTRPYPAEIDLDSPPAAVRSPVIFAAGRLSREKGFDLLIAAFAEFHRARPEWRLEIAGTGPEREALAAQVAALGLERSVSLPGHVSDVAVRLRAAEIFVLSSRHEAYPMVLCEAMAAGSAIIAANCPTGPAELVENGRNGILVPPESAEALAQAMTDLAGDEARRHRLRRGALATAPRLSAEAVMPDWTRLIEEARGPQGLTIVWVIDSLGLGGAQKHLIQQVTGLRARGHRALVFCLNGEAHSLHLAALRAAGAWVRVLGKTRVATGAAIVAIAAETRRERADLVVPTLFVSTIVGRLAARLAGVPSVTCLQSRNLNYVWRQKALLRLTAPLNACTLSNGRLSLVFAAQHEGADPERCHYVCNGIDVPAAPVAAQTWDALGWPQLAGRRVIGSIGRLAEQKGYDLLLAAFAGLAAEQGDVSLLLIGRGPEAAALEAQARSLGLQDRVIFAGERADALSLLPALALYVQPSRFEGMPNALMEAMAAGRPVVASAVDGITELVGDRTEGRLVPPGDEKALTAALREALADPAGSQAMGERARLAMRQEFEVKVMVDAYEKHFLEHASRPRSSGAPGSVNLASLPLEGGNWPSLEHRLLLQACLRTDRSAVGAWEDWRRCVDFDAIDGGSMRMIPLLYHNLHRLGVSDPVMERYKGVHRQRWWKNQQLFQHLAAVVGALHQAGIPTLVLKGAALANEYYPKPGLRPMVDCDLLIPYARATEGIRLLFELGWKSMDGQTRAGVEQEIAIRHGHDFTLPDRCGLDLHWHVLYTPTSPEGDGDFWAAATEMRLAGVTTRTLCSTDHLLHTCEHGVPWSPTPSLRWVADAMMILSRPDRPIDWERLLEQARVRRLSIIVGSALAYLQRHFDAPIPTGIIQAMLSSPAGAFEKAEFRAITSGGWIPRNRYYFWFRFRRLRRAEAAANQPSALAAYVRYLQASWKLAASWQIPPHVCRALCATAGRTLKRAFTRPQAA